jgi:hypothetical protein
VIERMSWLERRRGLRSQTQQGVSHGGWIAPLRRHHLRADGYRHSVVR